MDGFAKFGKIRLLFAQQRFREQTLVADYPGTSKYALAQESGVCQGKLSDWTWICSIGESKSFIFFCLPSDSKHPFIRFGSAHPRQQSWKRTEYFLWNFRCAEWIESRVARNFSDTFLIFTLAKSFLAFFFSQTENWFRWKVLTKKKRNSFLSEKEKRSLLRLEIWLLCYPFKTHLKYINFGMIKSSHTCFKSQTRKWIFCSQRCRDTALTGPLAAMRMKPTANPWHYSCSPRYDIFA